MNHDELVEKMMDGYDSSADNTFRKFCRDESGRAGMSAALRVAVEELLAPTTGQDTTYNSTNTRWEDLMKLVDRLLESRRSRYLKPKSAEERVTIHGGDEYWRVDLDNRCDAMFMKSSNYTRRHAETYRLGLIQQLKEQSK